jgi:ElaB/YqjD/DUF883 family membrane-anchored ribosome-binding protein
MVIPTDTQIAKERLISDFKTMVVDTEELLKATASHTGERVGAARAKVEEGLAVTKQRLADLEQGVVDRTKAMAQATDHLVHEHPWQAAGVAAAIGFLLGMLTVRRG